MAHIIGITPERDPYAEFQRALAQALDHIRTFVPPSFEINLVLRHKTDPQAHMVLGQSGPLLIRQAIDETMGSPSAFEVVGDAVDGFREVDAENPQ